MAAKKKTKTTKKQAATKQAAPKQRSTASKREPRPPRAAKAAPPSIETVIERVFKGQTIRVTRDADGLHYDGKTWKSLTAIALAVTGYKAISGPAFFGLTKRPTKGGAA